MQIALTLIIGIVAGAAGGLFGIGGGIVMVPAMALLLGFSQQKAQGTSLAVLMVPVALAAVINYYRDGFVDLKVAAIIACGFVVGAFFGSKVAVGLSPEVMKKTFAVFLILVAAQLWFTASRAKPVATTPEAPAAEQPAADPNHP